MRKKNILPEEKETEGVMEVYEAVYIEKNRRLKLSK